jgi:hypothetical protein
MGVNGDVTMTNLSTATGIGSNKLSFHHPNGKGNTTAMGDFLTDRIGRRAGASEWSQAVVDGLNGFDTFLGIPETTVQSGTAGLPAISQAGVDASIDNNGLVQINGGEIRDDDLLWVRVGTGIDPNTLYGEHFAEQIGKNSGALSIFNTVNLTPTGTRESGTDAGGRSVIDIQFKVDLQSIGTTRAELRLEDTVNTDATNYGDPSTQTGVSNNVLVMRCNDTEPLTTFIESINIFFSNDGGNGSYDDCAGDPLDQGGTQGDISYSARVSATVNDPTDQFGDLYLWVYIDADFSSLGCPGNQRHVGKQQATKNGDKTFCLGPDNEGISFSRGAQASTTFRVVLTRDDTATPTVQDERELTVTPDGGAAAGGSGDEGTTGLQNYSSKNTNTTC